MKKGFLMTLLASAITLSGITASYAIAPTIRQLPDVTIGDAEDNIGTQNNLFVFTNAFKFDSYVSDPDSTISQLNWSFDEGDPATGWFQVNGKIPMHIGTSAIGSADGSTSAAPHLNPAATYELRHNGSTPFPDNSYASFRDILFSPTSSGGPYANPSPTSHTKVVTFYVSDGSAVAQKNILVSSVDNAFDSTSGGAVFTVHQDDTFTTNSSPTLWSPFASGTTGFTPTSYDSVFGAYRVQVNSDASRYRVGGWIDNKPNWLPYSYVGTDRYVRVKYYIYATGQSTTAGNVIPNIRIRAAHRFSHTALLEIQHHDNSDPGFEPTALELKPSTNPAAPSIYRVDFDPVDGPYLVANKDAEGIERAFEAYSLMPQDNGLLGMSESTIGTYPASVLDNNAAGALVKQYRPAGNGATDGSDFHADSGSQIYDIDLTGLLEGQFPVADTTSGQPTATDGAFGVTMDTANVPSNRVGVVAREFYAGSTLTNRVRVSANEIYKVRYHITGTQLVSAQCQIRPRVRTIKFAYTQKFEIGGAWPTNLTANYQVAQEALPGVGCANPDKDPGDTTGGWYTVLVNTPISTDIGPQPTITALPGPGVNSSSNRDLRVGIDMIDTLSNGTNAVNEKGNYTLNKIDVYKFTQVAD